MKKTISISLILMFLVSFSTASETGLRKIYQDKFVEGYYVGFQEDRVIIEEYGGTKYRFPLTSGARMEIDGRPVKPGDFKPGMEVYAELEGRGLNYMDAFSADNPGYIQAGEKVRVGIIKEIDRNQIQIKMPTGKEETYFLSPRTIILKNKKNTEAKSLYIGDRVKLYFDEVDTSYISRVSIEGDSINVENIYRAKIALVDSLEDVISLESVDKFTNNKWESLEKNIKLPYNIEAPIYVGGEKINNRNLKHYRGKTVYMAIKDDFGKEKIEKMLIKARNEKIFSDKINKVSMINSQIKLDNSKNINIHEGTMVIKSGRLVDIYNLNPNSDGMIITDGRGNDLDASLIYIYNEDINNSNIGQDYIYAGRLNTILPDKLYLKDFFLLDKNDWESFPEEKELFYDDDTFIYNMEDKEKVSPKEFFSSDFSQDENNKDNKGLRDWYGYLYTDGDRISSIFIKKSIDSLLLQRTSTGKVEVEPIDNGNVGLTTRVKDLKTWSSSYEEWMAQNAPMNIYLEDAMIIKDGKKAEAEDIKLGDSLYFIREDNMAKVVIIKWF